VSKRIFVDCGGHDGCSAIQFLSQRPEFKSITFEPNPVFSGYYRYLPTKLIRKAVSTHDGTVAFTVDPIDGDGSSIIADKDVVFDRTLSNEQCPTVTVDCVDLSSFLKRTVQPGDYLCLKLDVEGAEYEILEKMIREGTIDLVNELFIEFHWQKCGVPKERHERLVVELKKHTTVTYWDAARYSIHKAGVKSRVRRALMLAELWPRHVMRSALNRG
jgi:FkbM family methyltransferase